MFLVFSFVILLAFLVLRSAWFLFFSFFCCVFSGGLVVLVCFAGREKTTERITEGRGIDMAAVAGGGDGGVCNSVHDAARSGNVEEVARFCDETTEAVNARDRHSRTPYPALMV